MNVKKHGIVPNTSNKVRSFLNFPLGNKKGAMELSVTAIVILILAIVMLGLGLGFIRGMFGKVSTQFEEQIAAEPEPPASAALEPITFSRERIITNAGETKVLKVGFYNPTSRDLDVGGGGAEEVVDCERFEDRNGDDIVDYYDGLPYTANREDDPYYIACNDIGCTRSDRTFSIRRGRRGRRRTYYSYGLYCENPDPSIKCKDVAEVPDPLTCADIGCSAGCGGASGGLIVECPTLGIAYKSNTKTVNIGESEVFNVLVTIDPGADEGSHLCSLKVSDYTKDFIIGVKR